MQNECKFSEKCDSKCGFIDQDNFYLKLRIAVVSLFSFLSFHQIHFWNQVCVCGCFIYSIYSKLFNCWFPYFFFFWNVVVLKWRLDWKIHDRILHCNVFFEQKLVFDLLSWCTSVRWSCSCTPDGPTVSSKRVTLTVATTMRWIPLASPFLVLWFMRTASDEALPLLFWWKTSGKKLPLSKLSYVNIALLLITTTGSCLQKIALAQTCQRNWDWNLCWICAKSESVQTTCSVE